jgi:organic radical activating enzyme
MYFGYMNHADYPSWLEKTAQNPALLIELSSVCNFRCKYCQSEKSSRRKGQMTDETFYRIVNQLNDDFRPIGIGLHVDGEPTIHPKFHEYADAAIKTGIPVTCATNGSRLSTDLLDLDLKFMITISTNPEEFTLRSSMSFEQYIDNITNYLAAWNETGSNQTIFLRMPIVDSDVAQGLVDDKMDFVVDLFKKAGLSIDRLDKNETCFLTAKNDKGFTVTAEKLFIVSDGIFTIMPGNEKRAIEHEDLSSGFCDIGWKMMVVYWDGSVGFCCHDIEGKNVYADKDELMEKGLKDLWLSHPRMQAIRENFLNRKVLLPLCRECLKIYPSREFYANHPAEFCPDVALAPGDVVSFAETGARERLCRAGFAKAGQPYFWTTAKVSSIGFKLSDKDRETDLALEVDYCTFAPKELGENQNVRVYINQNKIMQIPMEGIQPAKTTIHLPRKLLKAENILTFRFDERKSPHELGLSEDRRKLGIGINRIAVVRDDG